MQNRISQLVQNVCRLKDATRDSEQTQFSLAASSAAPKLCQRPTLRLTNHSGDRPITVDMERFFDFSFSFAEALLDLESQFQQSSTDATSSFTADRMAAERMAAERADLRQPESTLDAELDFDIDARWI